MRLECLFVRCIRPNDVARPDFVQPSIVRRQLKSLNVSSSVRFQQVGFPIRRLYRSFFLELFVAVRRVCILNHTLKERTTPKKNRYNKNGRCEAMPVFPSTCVGWRTRERHRSNESQARSRLEIKRFSDNSVRRRWICSGKFEVCPRRVRNFSFSSVPRKCF